jgi:hypothetical protein
MERRKVKEKKIGYFLFEIVIGLIQVGKHSGWLFSGLMAF